MNNKFWANLFAFMLLIMTFFYWHASKDSEMLIQENDRLAKKVREGVPCGMHNHQF